MSKVVQQRPSRHAPAAGTSSGVRRPGTGPASAAGASAAAAAAAARAAAVVPGTEHLIAADSAAVAAETAAVAAAPANRWGAQRISKKEKRRLKHDKFMTFLMPGDDANVVNGIHVPKGTAGKATAKNKLSFSEAFQDALPSAEELAEAATASARRTGASLSRSASVATDSAAGVRELTKATRAKANKDREKFGLVLAHPVFRANPLATIKEHLQNELALAALQEEGLRGLAKSAMPSKAEKKANSKAKKGGAGRTMD